MALIDLLTDGSLSDLIVSNNNDMPKVLSTVFQSVLYFFKERPGAAVFIKGSTNARTRLYQMANVKYLDELEQKFRILGFIGEGVELFRKGENYDGFIVALK